MFRNRQRLAQIIVLIVVGAMLAAIVLSFIPLQ